MEFWRNGKLWQLLWSWRGLPEPRNLETPCWMTNDSEVYWLGLGNWVNQVPLRDESPVTCNAFWDWFKKTVLFFLLISFIHKLSHNELLYWLRIRVETISQFRYFKITVMTWYQKRSLNPRACRLLLLFILDGPWIRLELIKKVWTVSTYSLNRSTVLYFDLIISSCHAFYLNVSWSN